MRRDLGDGEPFSHCGEDGQAASRARCGVAARRAPAAALRRDGAHSRCHARPSVIATAWIGLRDGRRGAGLACSSAPAIASISARVAVRVERREPLAVDRARAERHRHLQLRVAARRRAAAAPASSRRTKSSGLVATIARSAQRDLVDHAARRRRSSRSSLVLKWYWTAPTQTPASLATVRTLTASSPPVHHQTHERVRELLGGDGGGEPGHQRQTMITIRLYGNRYRHRNV